jgi:zinc transport system substrate-binding protein
MNGELLDVPTLTLLEAGEDDHGHGHDEHEHDDENVDPHIWLDPTNSRTLIMSIAKALAEQDSDNASHYLENAKAAVGRIDALSSEITELMTPIAGRQYVVVHDGYRYFEERFELGRAIAISDGHASRPGARRISEVREILRDSEIRCVFDEVQLDAKTVTSIVRGTDARRATLDPMGSKIEPGPDLYEKVIRGHAKAMIDCLS